MRDLGPAVIVALLVVPATLVAQISIPPAGQVTPIAAAQPELPPATKLEGFKSAAGSVVTLGYDDLGGAAGVRVEVREMRDAQGGARGLLVQITESQVHSFVDADEIPELLKGLDALIEIKANPTPFKMFEVRYTTRGDLRLTAFNNAKGAVQYDVQVGRTQKAHRLLEAADLLRLRGLFDAALQKLNSMSAK
jgi:hypothetical protein